MAIAHRSIHPNIPGVPWWAAVLTAVTATAIGFAFDAGSGNKQLTNVFAGLYLAGCVAAVLAVQQSGIFTAVVQPPLILFFTVPGAYWLFHGAKITGVKDIVINCGYPLIERFPLMLFTSAGVLLIGIARWYLGMARRRASTAKSSSAQTGKPAIIATLAAIFRRSSEDKSAAVSPGRSHRVHAVSRSSRAADRRRGGRAAQRAAPSRSRHTRPAMGDSDGTDDRVIRRRPTSTRGFEPSAEPPAATRRSWPRDSDLRAHPLRERRDPPVRQGRPRRGRVDPHVPRESPETHESQLRRPASAGANSVNATHHPISRVRYRGSAPEDEPDTRPRDRYRPPQPSTAETWEYDI